MREKIILQDFSILLICTSHKWLTIERRVIVDSVFLRNMGCSPLILCLKGSQVDIAAEAEDLPRVYIQKKINYDLGVQFLLELRKIILKNKFDIVHCYSLLPTWISAFILKSHQEISLFCTLNQHIHSFHHNLFSKWLLKRVDYIFTLSSEIQEFVQEALSIHPRKVKSMGSGLEVIKKKERSGVPQIIGCVINSTTELKHLKSVVKTFRLLKTHSDKKFDSLALHIFLGPRVFQKNSAKRVLTELDYEFYEGDVLLFKLEGKRELLKDLDVFLGTAFDEPLNDFEVISVLSGVPTLFPRTAARQGFLFRYRWIGESYIEGDIREAKAKLSNILEDYQKYVDTLSEISEEITLAHGFDVYAENVQKYYQKAFSKRSRFNKARLRLGASN